MGKFVLLFRMDLTGVEVQPSTEQMEIYMEQWMGWINDIAEKDMLADGGNHFSKEGRVLRPNDRIIHQPYIAYNLSVAGYIIILAKNLDEATKIAKKCPVLNGQNTCVEIRETARPDA